MFISILLLFLVQQDLPPDDDATPISNEPQPPPYSECERPPPPPYSDKDPCPSEPPADPYPTIGPPPPPPE